MKYFPLQVAIILGAGLATGFAFSMNSKVQLHLDPNINKGIPAPQPKGPSGPTGTASPTGTTAPTGQPAPTGATAPTGQPAATAATGPTATAPTGETTDVFVSLDYAKKLFDSHSAVFIDARPKAEFLKSHITGAMQLEKGDLDAAPPAKVLNYLPGSAVIVYCHGQLCTDSENVVKRLVALNKGIGPFHIIKDGFPGWEAAKYPIETGPEVGFE